MGGCREEDMGCQTCVELVLLLPCHLMLLLAAADVVVVAQKLLALQRRCGNFDMGPGQPQWDNETVGQTAGRQMRQCDAVKICFAFKSNKK